MIARAKKDIANGEVSSMTLKFIRNRYRISESDAHRLRESLIQSGYIREASGNRFVVC